MPKTSLQPNLTAKQPCLDWEGALERLDGSIEVYIQLAELFLADIDQAHAELHRLLADPATEEQAAKWLHRLRGSALTLGAEELARALHEAEQALSGPESIDPIDPIDRTTLGAEIDAVSSRTQKMLRALIETLGTAASSPAAD